jgi:PPOX class probable F420-dependent enzyme
LRSRVPAARGGLIAQLDQKQKEFLENPYVGIATTLRDDGSPHSTVVWVDVRDGSVGFNTARGRAKVRHLERDSRVALTVVDPNDEYKWLTVTGRGELTEEGADAQIDKLAQKYVGEEKYPWRKPGEERVSVWITPEKVDATGINGGSG